MNLTNWTLYEARSISADGLTITSAGMHTIPGIGVRQEAWAVALPGPGPATLFLLAAGFNVRRRTRRVEPTTR